MKKLNVNKIKKKKNLVCVLINIIFLLQLSVRNYLLDVVQYHKFLVEYSMLVQERSITVCRAALSWK